MLGDEVTSAIFQAERQTCPACHGRPVPPWRQWTSGPVPRGSGQYQWRGTATGARRLVPVRALLPFSCCGTSLQTCLFTYSNPERANGVFSNAVGLSTLLASTQLLAGLSIELTSA